MGKIPIPKYVACLPPKERNHFLRVASGKKNRPGGWKWLVIGLAVLIASFLIGVVVMIQGAYCLEPFLLSMNPDMQSFCLYWAWIVPYLYWVGAAIVGIGIIAGMYLINRRFMKMPPEEQESEEKKIEEKYGSK